MSLFPSYLGSITVLIGGSPTMILNGLALLNVSIYSIIHGPNYRSVMNYVVISSLTLVLITIGYVYIDLIKDISIWIALIGIGIKLGMFPYTTWSLPVYSTIKLEIAMWLIIISKVTYIGLIGQLPLNIFIWILILIGLSLGSIVVINSTDIYGLVLLSGSIQLIYIILPILSGNELLAQFYLVLYTLHITILSALLIYPVRNLLAQIILFSVLFSFSGIPPFIGFYSKILVLSSYLINGFNTYFIVLLVIVSSAIVSFIYFNFAQKSFNNSVISEYYPRLDWLTYLLFVSIFIFPMIGPDILSLI